MVTAQRRPRRIAEVRERSTSIANRLASQGPGRGRRRARGPSARRRRLGDARRARVSTASAITQSARRRLSYDASRTAMRGAICSARGESPTRSGAVGGRHAVEAAAPRPSLVRACWSAASSNRSSGRRARPAWTAPTSPADEAVGCRSARPRSGARRRTAEREPIRSLTRASSLPARTTLAGRHVIAAPSSDRRPCRAAAVALREGTSQISSAVVDELRPARRLVAPCASAAIGTATSEAAAATTRPRSPVPAHRSTR